MVAGRRVVSVERTAKRFKARAVVFALMFFGGAGVLVAHGGRVNPDPRWVTLGVLSMAVGALGLVLTRVGIWWHHS